MERFRRRFGGFFAKPGLWAAVLLLLAAALAGPSIRADEPLRVAAASSLADVLREINEAFVKEGGAKIELNLGASNVLARQIAAGARADVFISADTEKMDEMVAKGLIEKDTREDQLSNRLVVVVPADSALEIRGPRDLAEPRVRRIATGDPRAVPVGVYAKAYFEKQGLWERLAPKVVATDNARAALAAVESGNVDAGIVYRTDARISRKVRVAWEVPASEGPAITYPMAAIKGSAQAAMARRYLAYLDGAAARKVFERHGFIVLPEPDGDR